MFLFSRYFSFNLFNSAYFIEGGEIQEVHNKLRLVPFGEYIPFKSFFTLVGLDTIAYSMGVGTFQRGKEYTIFSLEEFKAHFGVLVCFEDTMPDLARNFVKNGANVLLNITNDAWFLDTAEPFQHLQASILRAVENHCHVLRAANTGVSAFISPHGKIIRSIQNDKGRQTFVLGTITEPIFISHHVTFYQKLGYLFPWLTLLFVLIYGALKVGNFFLPIRNKTNL